MIQQDPEFLLVIAQDLEHLQSAWGAGGIGEAALRRESDILHRFVCQRDLQTAWNMVLAPERLMIEGLKMEDVLRGLPKTKITFASLGGTIRSTGLQVRGSFVVKGRIDINALNPSSGPPMPAPLKLSKFASSVCIVYEGRDITRFDLIEYVRNKLGGGHFDTKRSKETEVMLDAIAQQYQINDQNAIYHEFLAVGQNVASSPDIQRLLSAINEKGIPHRPGRTT